MQRFQQRAILRRQRRRTVQHRQHQRRRLQTGTRPLHPNSFHGIVRLAQPGGIRQPQRHIAQPHGFLHHIAGGAGDRGHNAALPSRQLVHQSGFADIGAPHDRGIHPFAQHPPRIKGGKQRFHLLPCLTQHRPHGGWLQIRNIIVRVIHKRRKLRRHSRQLLPHTVHPGGEMPLAGGQRSASRQPAAGGDAVHHRFGGG